MDTIELKVKIYQTDNSGESQILDDTVSEFVDNANIDWKESDLVVKVAECIADSYGVFREDNMPSLDDIYSIKDLPSYIDALNKKAKQYEDALDFSAQVTKVEVNDEVIYENEAKEESSEKDNEESDPAEKMYDIFDKGLSDEEASEEEISESEAISGFKSYLDHLKHTDPEKYKEKADEYVAHSKKKDEQ